MDFIDFKKHLVNQKNFPCYTFKGEDLFLINSCYSLAKKYIINDNSLLESVYSTENLVLETLKNSINSFGFFAGKKIITIKEFEGKLNADLVELINNYLERPSDEVILLLICSGNSDCFSSIKKSEVVNCNRLNQSTLIAWINSYVKNKNASINSDAIITLIEYCSYYLSRISLELEKLLSYVNNVTITKEDVMLIVNKDLEFNVFELTESIVQRNNNRAMNILSEMLGNKKSSPIVLNLIQNYFRRLFYVAVSTGDNAEISGYLGIKEYAVKISKQHCAKFTKLQLKNIINKCDELEFFIKSGQIENNIAVTELVLFIINCLNK